jgi:hypothetical protein
MQDSSREIFGKEKVATSSQREEGMWKGLVGQDFQQLLHGLIFNETAARDFHPESVHAA